MSCFVEINYAGDTGSNSHSKWPHPLSYDKNRGYRVTCPQCFGFSLSFKVIVVVLLSERTVILHP